MVTDRQQYDYLYPQNGETYEKVRAIIYCPRCKENYWAYITKKGKKRGILIKVQEATHTLYKEYCEFTERRVYKCNVCGFTWHVKCWPLPVRIVKGEQKKKRKEERY